MSRGTTIGEPWALWRGPDTLAVGRGWGDPRKRYMCSDPALLALSAQLLATLLTQYERLRGVQSSGVLVIFWFLCVVCAIIPFRSKILSALAKVRGKRGTCQAQPYLEFKVTAGSQAASPLLPGRPLLFSPFCVVPSLLYLCWEGDWGTGGED